MRSPKLRVWMLLLAVGLLAFVMNEIVEVRRERERVKAWRALRLNERWLLAKSWQHADDELSWNSEGKMWEQRAEGLRNEIKWYKENILIRRSEPYSPNDKFHIFLTNKLRYAERRAEWFRLRGSRSGGLKRKYAHASTQPAERVAPDPPEPIEPNPDSLIDVAGGASSSALPKGAGFP